MKIALKEWAAVIRALERGRQIFLLRKGGLAETKRGFELAHPEFVFYPTWEHQQRAQLQPAYQPWFDETAPTDETSVHVTAGARAAEIIEAPPDPSAWEAVRDRHVWSDDYIRMRYDYRPDLPLRIVLLRVFRLPKAEEIPYDRRYGGCRSWVELYDDVEIVKALPVLDEGVFMRERSALLEGLGLQAKT
ncbi:MAG: DUF1802 family protein [Acidobacteria bacterium]|nr:DUF1802 family protein [Acidobacteriota bacterium]